jgi:PelA/Pel-15E family pectate lyase
MITPSLVDRHDRLIQDQLGFAAPWPAEITAPALMAAMATGDEIGWKTIPQGAATTCWAATAPELEAHGGAYLEDCHVAEPTDDPVSGTGVRGYATDAAQEIAGRVVARQTRAGAWTKGNDYTSVLVISPVKADVWSGGTLDNDATTWEMRFLARVAAAAAPGDVRVAGGREAFLRGLLWLSAAQYPNGGFPQIYPLAGGYHDAITFNDNAMTQTLELLREVGVGRAEFAFVSAELRADATARLTRGIACILAAQLRDGGGRRTGWCQQHDMLTLQACAARNYEPVAACTNESAALVRFLMTLESPSPEVATAIRGAVDWFKRTALQNLVWTRQGGSGQLLAHPGALGFVSLELAADAIVVGNGHRPRRARVIVPSEPEALRAALEVHS